MSHLLGQTIQVFWQGSLCTKMVILYSVYCICVLQVSGGGGMPPVDTIRRDEVNAVLANQRELVSAARDIKNFVADVHNKVRVFKSEVNASC